MLICHLGVKALRCPTLWQLISKFYYSTSIKDTHPIYLLPETDPTMIPFLSDFRIVPDIQEFCIPSLKSGGKKRRPELVGDIRSVYTLQEAARINSHQSYIQESITKKLLGFLDDLKTPSPKLILDIGCGTGLSTMSATENGHQVVGIDINMPMVLVASSKNSSSCDYFITDCRLPIPIRHGIFDGVVSVSFLHWLTKTDDSFRTLRTFFSSVSNCLKPSGCFGAQFYPKDSEEVIQIVNAASDIFVGVLLACRPCVERGLKLFLVLLKPNRKKFTN